MQRHNLVDVTIPHLFVNSRVVFGGCISDNGVDFELFLLHLLMVTSALMGVSRFNKSRHQVKDVVESSLGFDLESVLIIF